MAGSCLCEKLFLQEKRSQGSSLERALQHAVDLMDRVVRGDAWQQGVQGWWTGVGDHMEKRIAIEDETGEAWQIDERRWDGDHRRAGDKSREGGFRARGDAQELAGEAQEHTEVGTAIEIRRVRDTVIRTEWFDLSWVIYSPNFPPEILNRLKWFQMLSLFRTIQENVCCFEKKGGVRDGEKKERKEK